MDVNEPVARKLVKARSYLLATALMSVIVIGLAAWDNGHVRHAAMVQLGLKQPLQTSPASFYQQRVDPVFERYCVSCHNSDKARGEWRAHTFYHAMVTGESHESIVPGNAAASQVIQRMLLSENQIRAMPPAGHDRPTSDELEVLRIWIDAGADGLARADRFPDAPPPLREISFREVDPRKVADLRRPLANEVAQLSKRFPFVLSYIARDSQGLRVNDSSYTLDDVSFAELSPILPEVRSVDLRRSKLGNSSITALQKLENVETLMIQASSLNANEISSLLRYWKHIRNLTLPAGVATDELREKLAARNVLLFERR